MNKSSPCSSRRIHVLPSIFLASITAVGLLVSACTDTPSSSSFVASPRQDNHLSGKDLKRGHRLTNNPIDRVFIIVQENRTVDNLFNGFPGANTQSFGYFGSTQVPLKPDPMQTGEDLPHTLKAFNKDTGCAPTPGPAPCPMNGFSTPSALSGDAYAYVKQSD